MSSVTRPKAAFLDFGNIAVAGAVQRAASGEGTIRHRASAPDLVRAGAR